MSKSLYTAMVLAMALSLRAATPEEPAHWAYQPLVRPPIPRTEHTRGTRNDIDHFVAAKLASAGSAPSREADQRTLLRRVFFDLIGLPPTPEEMRAFLEDSSPGAWERVVDRLLASPRHGERWARHWMDAVHFAETHGHDQDRIRTNAWPYRDYLIESFNRDKPYARFVQEQIAGDVLFPGDPQATMALGFLAAGPWDESSLRDIREDTLDRQIARYVDRDDMVTTAMQTFTSTTVQCARCHNHKFDPVPQTDYYALQAVFAGVDRADRTYDADPAVHRERTALLRRRESAKGDRAWLLSAEVEREVDAFEKAFDEARRTWKTLEPQTFVSTGGATLTKQQDHSILAGGPRPDRDTYTISAQTSSRTISVVRLETLADESLPKRGPGRQDNGNLHLSEFQLLVFEPGAPRAREIPFAGATADFNQSGWTIGHALDRNEKTAWGIFPNVGEPHHALFTLKEPLAVAEGTSLVFVLKQLHGDGHLIGRVRLAVSADASASTSVVPDAIEEIIALPKPARNDDTRATLAAFVVKANIARDLARLPKPSLVYAAASDFEPDGGHKPAGAPRAVHVLRRGDINRPLDAAAPGALSCVAGMPSRFDPGASSDEGSRRAALARWLTHPTNALTWRSIVNRVWHHHFGRGLVDTPNDFGKMGSAPSHPELLDWLAVWFRDDTGGSLKALHRLIVTSATYRQGSAMGKLASEISKDAEGFPRSVGVPLPHQSKSAVPDPDNRLLSRMNRTRLDAEQVRDAILQISGCLDSRMGGPSDMQFEMQPGHHVTPKVDYTRFDVSSSAARRRSVYRFLFRTLPDPFMDALDCPAGDQLTAARNTSVTVQQALAMWNDAFVVHYAEQFARRVQSGARTTGEQIALACELALSRPPTEDERQEFGKYVEKHGLPNFCRVLLNSNEFMFVN